VVGVEFLYINRTSHGSRDRDVFARRLGCTCFRHLIIVAQRLDVKIVFESELKATNDFNCVSTRFLH